MGYNYVELGQSNLQDDVKALFRDQFVPLLLTRFDEKRVMKNLVRNKTITKGKSASFPLFGKVSAEYIGRGEKLGGNQDFAKTETTIYVDPYLATSYVLYELDEKMSETEDRDIIATEMARALANTEDKQLLQVGVKAARMNSIITGGYGGTVLKYGSDVETDGGKLAAAVYNAGVVLDEKDVPEEDRMAFLRPFQFALLAQYEDVKNHDIGSGSYSDGTTGKINNIKIIKTNHLPSTNITIDSNVTNPNNVYHGNFSNTVGLVMTKDAIATVSLIGLKTECTWDAKYICHLLTARIAQGHGVLRPECAVEISKEAGASDDSEETSTSVETSTSAESSVSAETSTSAESSASAETSSEG